MNIFIRAYVERIKKGDMTIEQVPEVVRDEVEAIMRGEHDRLLPPFPILLNEPLLSLSGFSPLFMPSNPFSLKGLSLGKDGRLDELR